MILFFLECHSSDDSGGSVATIVVGAAFHCQVLSPALFPIFDVFVAEGASPGGCRRLRGITLFGFGVRSVVALMDRLLASWAPLVVFAVATF